MVEKQKTEGGKNAEWPAAIAGQTGKGQRAGAGGH